MAADFWTVEFKINFNNVGAEGVLGEAFGWTEKYYIPGTKGAPPYTEAIALQAARASLMARNVNIVKTSMRLASMYKDQWNIPVTATYPLITLGDTFDPDYGNCNSVQDALLLRFESANGRRWNRTIRGIRDAWIYDQTWLSDLTRNSYGSVSPPDLAIPAPLTVGGTPGVNGAITFTNTSGVLSLPLVGTAGSGIAIEGVSTGTFPILIPGYTAVSAGSFRGYVVDVTLTAGVITGVAVNQTQDNSVYPATTTSYAINTQVDSLGLPWYLFDFEYLLNFCGLQAGPSSTVQNFHTALVTPAGPDAGRWPAGSLMPVVDQTAPRYAAAPYQAVRFMIERVTNRQTGRIWTSKKARRKIAR